MEMTIEQAVQAFDASASSLDSMNLDAALELVKSDLGNQTEQSFEEKTDPDGAPWAPQAHDYGNPLMVRTGFLYLAVGDQIEAAQIADNQMLLSDDAAVLPKYAQEHTQGTAKMPARPFNGFGESTIDKAVEYGVTESIRQLTEPWQ